LAVGDLDCQKDLDESLMKDLKEISELLKFRNDSKPKNPDDCNNPSPRTAKKGTQNEQSDVKDDGNNESKTQGVYNDQSLVEGYLDMIPLRFGDLAALAGDHVENEDQLKNMILEFARYPLEPEPGQRIIAMRSQWLSACQWYFQNLKTEDLYKPLTDCFDNEEDQKIKYPKSYKNIKKLQTNDIQPSDLRKLYHRVSVGYERSRHEQAEFEALPDYGVKPKVSWNSPWLPGSITRLSSRVTCRS
jgi:hypothetical protein